MIILKDIKQYTKLLKKIFKYRISQLSEVPKLAIIQVGNIEASNLYIRNKVKDCEEVGIEAQVYHYDENITEYELCKNIKLDQEFYDGVIVQLPLPPHIRQEVAVAAISPDKDVDGFRHDSWFEPVIPKGIIDYLKYCEFDIEGKDVVILGCNNIVSKPLARMMIDANATVTLCNSKSKIDEHIQNADLIISAVEKANFLNCENINVPVIDVSINFDDNGKLIGDCGEQLNVSLVLGSAGLLGRTALLDNVIKRKEKEEDIKKGGAL